MFNTPILLLIFNRPETTKLVFEEIKKQNPKYLFIAADGPRPEYPNDADLTKKCREIVSEIDWACEVTTLYQKKNLGCGAGPATAITWFFKHVKEGIIIEDDIFPDPSFFGYCEQMLQKFRHNDSIMHISGGYYLKNFTTTTPSASYYFTKHIHVWGWATWRRAWNHYDYDMKELSLLNRVSKLRDYYGDYFTFWKQIFTNMKNKGNDIWDYQWMFAVYRNNGLAMNPTRNLTRNIGFGSNATHTKDPASIYTTVSLSSLSTIVHPAEICVNTYNDDLYYRHYLNFNLQNELVKRKLLWKLKTCLRKFKRRFKIR